VPDRKAEQEGHWEKKENDVTQDETEILHAPNLGALTLKCS
jgi:hypothetical protein